jgi:chemotaxis protein CheX
MTLDIAQIEDFTAEAVKNVFQSMLSMDIAPEDPPTVGNNPDGQIIGAVGFAGEASGIICIYAGLPFATVITSRMLGIEESEVDTSEMVNDAFGELSNMVAGFVKSHLCDGGLPCTLTIPSIVRGQQLSVERSSQIMRRIIGFKNSHHHMIVEILLKKPQF